MTKVIAQFEVQTTNYLGSSVFIDFKPFTSHSQHGILTLKDRKGTLREYHAKRLETGNAHQLKTEIHHRPEKEPQIRGSWAPHVEPISDLMQAYIT